MNVPKITEYDAVEYQKLLIRQDGLPKAKKDFKNILGVDMKEFEVTEMRYDMKLSPPVMFCLVNYFQVIDKLVEDFSKRLFFCLMDLDFEENTFRLLLGNLILKQFLKKETGYLAVYFRRKVPGSMRRRIWNLALYRVPDEQLSVHVNCFEQTFKLEVQQLSQMLYSFFHEEFQNYDANYHIPWRNGSLGDGALETLWFIYQVIRGVEVENVRRVEYNQVTWAKILHWIILKIKFQQPEDSDVEEEEVEEKLPEIDTKWRQRVRYFRSNAPAVQQKPQLLDASVQTDFTIEKLMLFDFGRYENRLAYHKREKKDAFTETEEHGTQISGGVQKVARNRNPLQYSQPLFEGNDKLQNKMKQQLQEQEQEAKQLRKYNFLAQRTGVEKELVSANAVGKDFTNMSDYVRLLLDLEEEIDREVKGL